MRNKKQKTNNDNCCLILKGLVDIIPKETQEQTLLLIRKLLQLIFKSNFKYYSNLIKLFEVVSARRIGGFMSNKERNVQLEFSTNDAKINFIDMFKLYLKECDNASLIKFIDYNSILIDANGLNILFYKN
jgi:hypothetical protein